MASVIKWDTSSSSGPDCEPCIRMTLKSKNLLSVFAVFTTSSGSNKIYTTVKNYDIRKTSFPCQYQNKLKPVRRIDAGIGFGPCNQWYDYMTVQRNDKIRIFMWLVQCNDEDMYDYHTPVVKPLMIHVGGPEMSASGFGFFYETGPMTDKNYTRSLPLTDFFNILYIDVPIGVGFSYSDVPDHFSSDVGEIARDVQHAVLHTLKEHDHLKTSPVFLYCESYACKYTVEAAYLLNKFKVPELQVEYLGVVLGSPWINPIKMVSEWSSYSFAWSLMSKIGQNEMNQIVKEDLDREIKINNWIEAAKLFKKVQQIFTRITDGLNGCNVMVEGCGIEHLLKGLKDEDSPAYITSLINCGIWPKKLFHYMNKNVKPRLGDKIPQHIVWNTQEILAIRALLNDFMRPDSEKYISLLLKETQMFVVVIGGQVDLITNNIALTKWIDEIDWIGKDGITKATHTSFKSGRGSCEGIIGYYRQYNQLYHFQLLYTGHLIAKENHKGLRRILEIVMGI